VRHTLCYMLILQGASHIVLYADTARCVTYCVICRYCKVRHTLCYMQILQGASHIVLYADTARCVTHCVICRYCKVRHTLCLLEPKLITVPVYSSHNTAILSGVYNLSTACFGHCCCGHHQVGYNLSEKLYRYDITQNNY
jgi:hypothetical protein